MEQKIKLYEPTTSQKVQWLRVLCFLMQRVQVQSLVRKLRSHMPRGLKKQNIKQKQYCNKFKKAFKKGPHQTVLREIYEPISFIEYRCKPPN